jgi:crotonobetainyl-CoA:carnitine CoA-transferase CaiB-like acyl-CoA transferase
VLVEGFRPGVMARLGLGYEALREANRRLVYCAISGYGQDGPLAQAAGHDINYVGYSGVGDQIGRAGQPPTVPNFQIADLLGGTLSAVMGILAAVLDARARGEGRFVDVSMTDSVLAHGVFPLMATLEGGGRAPPRGTSLLSGGAPCYDVYETADHRWMAVGALEEKFWHTLCDGLGAPDLKPRQFAGGDADAVRGRLAAIFRTKTQAEWTAHFATADCCVTPVLTTAEALAHPLFAARGMVKRTPHPAGGDLVQFAPPVAFSDFAFAIERPAPGPGEHTDAVLAEAGYSRDEIAALRAAGVV